MKNSYFEALRKRSWVRLSTKSVTVSRSALIRAFSTQEHSRSEVLKMVSKYIGNCPVPPSWSRASVEGEFGKKVARLWCRHIRHLRPASYRGENGRWLHPVTQTLHDFKATPKSMKVASSKPASFVPIDEFHMLSR